MDLSLFLAKVLGLYMLIGGLALLVNKEHFEHVVRDFTKSRVLPMFSGMLELLLGLMLVVSHNIWVSDWPVIITVVGWLALLEGLFFFFLPTQLQKMASWFKPGAYTFFGIVYVVLGLYLAYVGFFI